MTWFKDSSTIRGMISVDNVYGTWAGEPASEDGWGVDWSIAEPDPEFIEREAYKEMYQTDIASKRD